MVALRAIINRSILIILKFRTPTPMFDSVFINENSEMADKHVLNGFKFRSQYCVGSTWK